MTDQQVTEASNSCLQQCQQQVDRLLAIAGSKSVDYFHRRLGKIMWDKCGMARNEKGLQQALSEIPELRAEFWQELRIVGTGDSLNQCLEKAGRVADFLEFAELMCRDALARKESCGGHFREEYQTDDGEAQRDDKNYSHASVWQYRGDGQPLLHKEKLHFQRVTLTQRSYK